MAQNWWVGIWTGDPDWCSAAGQIGEVSPAPIEISETAIRGYEYGCDISKAREVGKVNAALLRLNCSGEGETYKEQRLILKQDENAIWIWWGDGEPILFTRCKG